MELTGGGLLGLLCLVTAGLTAVTVWAWPRHGTLLRSALLTASHVALAVSVVAAANSYFYWYGTWGDLLGVQAAMPKEARLAVGARLQAADPLANVATDLWDRRRAENPARYGELEYVRIGGLRTGYDQQAYVLLPPEYFQPRYATRHFPVVLMLTGYPGATKSLVVRLKLPAWVEQGRAAGRLQPTIYVMMQPTVAPPRDTECTDVPSGPQAASYFGVDVPDALKQMYRVSGDRAGWGIMGDSTGGYCAAKIAMLYSDRYGEAVNISGHFHALRDATTGDLWGGSQALRNANDLIWRIQHMPAPPIDLLVTSSKNGEKSYPQAMQFLSLVRPPLTADRIVLETGGHNYDTWGRVFPSVLDWMSRHQHVDDPQ